MLENTESVDILAAGRALGGYTQVEGGKPHAIIPEGYKMVDLERSLSAPIRNRGTTELNDQESFILFVQQHQTETTDLYFETRNPCFTAVFNGARDNKPAWGDHRAVYPMPHSPEWKTWAGKDGQKMGQEDFARFIETNLPDIVDPAAADMLEIALSLEAKKHVNFASGLRLSNGSNQLTYEEQVDGTAAKGKLQVPEMIRLGIPVFEGGDRYQVEARFRYRIQDGGKLVMWYELVRPHKIVEDAVQTTRDVICDRLNIVAFNGQPIE